MSSLSSFRCTLKASRNLNFFIKESRSLCSSSKLNSSRWFRIKFIEFFNRDRKNDFVFFSSFIFFLACCFFFRRCFLSVFSWRWMRFISSTITTSEILANFTSKCSNNLSMNWLLKFAIKQVVFILEEITISTSKN